MLRIILSCSKFFYTVSLNKKQKRLLHQTLAIWLAWPRDKNTLVLERMAPDEHFPKHWLSIWKHPRRKYEILAGFIKYEQNSFHFLRM